MDLCTVLAGKQKKSRDRAPLKERRQSNANHCGDLIKSLSKYNVEKSDNVILK